jgi:hypothetical protein
MPKLSSIAALVLSASILAAPAPQAANAAARPHRAAHAAGHSKAKAPAKPARSAHAATAGRRTTPRATKAFRTETATGPNRKGRVRPALRARDRRRGREKIWPGKVETVHLAIPAPLRGSHESLVHQNEMAESEGLERILDDADLEDRIAHGSLVPVPVSSALRINTDLPENRRYCRPWTAKFLTDLSQAHAERFAASSLEVTSAVRTVEYQRQLRRINGNAAAADGDIASPHLTGGTIDIAKAGMTAREIGWLRAWLIPLEQQGKIDVEEEFRQSCFHISVYKSYTEPAKAPRTPNSLAPLASASMLGAQGR